MKEATAATSSPDVLHAAVMRALESVPDPEMPISIVDLGLVEQVQIDGEHVSIDILPTFIGCPALAMIQAAIEAKVGDVQGVAQVSVTFINDPPWSVDRISEQGRDSLRAFGVTVPEKGDLSSLKSAVPSKATVELRTSASPVACPVCGSSNTRLDSPFGPTRCRMIYICDECSNQFEHMKKV